MDDPANCHRYYRWDDAGRPQTGAAHAVGMVSPPDQGGRFGNRGLSENHSAGEEPGAGSIRPDAEADFFRLSGPSGRQVRADAASAGQVTQPRWPSAKISSRIGPKTTLQRRAG